MALIPKVDEVDISDITNNLLSLQFESALSEEESKLLVLRRRSHALTVTACAQATYFVSILNEARHIALQLSYPDQHQASRVLLETMPKDPLRIGIIGCGRLGNHLANCFLTFGEINPQDLKISTRRPETLVDVQARGVTCVDNNVEVASTVHILFICVLPSQLPTVANEIKEHLQQHSIVYSFVSSVSSPKVRLLLGFTNIIRPEFEWSQKSGLDDWDYSLDLAGAFAVSRIIKQTCPLNGDKDDMVIKSLERFAEQMVYAFVNMCTSLQLEKMHVIDVINAVILGDSGKHPIEVKIQIRDILRQKPDKPFFPRFDLSVIMRKETPLTKKLTNAALRAAYVKRYCGVFEQYLRWKNLAAIQSKYSNF